MKTEPEKIILSNNDRRRAGLPTRRKADRRRRHFTRCEAVEAIAAFLDYCDGEPGRHNYHR